MKPIIIIFALTGPSAAGELPLSDPPMAPPLLTRSFQPAAPPSSVTGTPTERPAFCQSVTECEGGYCFEFSDGSQLNETFIDYSRRTGKASPATKTLCCSTGHCSTRASGPTLPTGNCRCGCAASECNCAHSPNVGKPLKSQTVEPGKAATSGQTYSGRRGLFGRFR
jgi:hypothetical protein